MKSRKDIVESIRLEGNPMDALVLSPKEFGEKYGLFGGTVIRVMQDLGYKTSPRKRCVCTPPIRWDERTSYLLGYFLGDGCMHEPRSGDYGQLDISSKDLEHLSLIRDLLCPELRIVQGHSTKGSWYRLFWTSKEWYHFMVECGIVQNKSEFGGNIQFPNDDNLNHFVRGLFDSDGCVSNTKYGIGLQATIMGHESYLGNLLKVVPGICDKIYSDSRSSAKWIGCSSSVGVRALYNFMYSNATIFMSRKRIRFEEKVL